MKQIREWLESGQEYALGVALYETHGKSRVVLSALRYGQNEFTRHRLKSELLKLLGTDVTANVTSVTTPKPVRVVDTSAKSVHVPQKAAGSPELQAQRRAWFAERNHLHPQLELVATDSERLAMSLRILELGDLISQSYEAGDTTDKPDTTRTRFAHVSDAGEIRRLLANLRPQRTKLKRRPDRAQDLAQVELDIKCLEEQLKRDGGEPKLHQGHRNGA